MGKTKARPAQIRGDGGGDDVEDADALAALEAHFLASFGQDPSSSSSSSSCSAPSSSSAPYPPSSKGHIRPAPRDSSEGHPEPHRKGKKRRREGASEATPADGRLRLEAPASESSPEDDPLQAILQDQSVSGAKKGKGKRADAKQVALPVKPHRRPAETVVFDEGGRRGDTMSGGAGFEEGSAGPDAKKQWRNFMKSHTANTGPDSMTSASETLRAKVAERRAAEAERERLRSEARGAGDDEDDADEAEQLTRDRQLSHLLNTTLFASGSAGDKQKKKKLKEDGTERSDLSSHSTLSRLLDLSSSTAARKGQTFGRGHGDKELRASQLAQMPAKMRQGIRSAAGNRAQLDVDRKAELGLLGDAHSRKLMGRVQADATMTGKAKAKRDRDRGLSMGVGRFQGGMLKLSKKDTDRMLAEPNDGGGGKRRGGGKGGQGRGPPSGKKRRSA